MGYQALLFCPDEKLAKVVSQVFSELEFSIEPVHEPFAAVKKLMSQRYDAIVVDCENEQNASLLFKSARNSSSNQSSLAIALVEGQAGVAKSYRIGANLVLTKPINVEQAKGTLRVARGLLRKNQDAAAATVAAPASGPAKISEPVAQQRPETPVAETRAPDTSQAKLPPTQSVSMPIPVPPSIPAGASAAMSAVPAQAEKTVAATQILTPKPPASPVVAQASGTSFSAASKFASATAAAPAPAKEAAVKATAPPNTESESARSFSSAQHSAPEFEAYGSAPAVAVASSTSVSPIVSSAPAFAELDRVESDGSQGSKKFLIAAAVIVIAVLAYFAYQKFGSARTSQPTTSDQSASQPGAHHSATESGSAPDAAPARPSTQSAVSSQPASSANSNAAHAAATAKPSGAKSAPLVAENTVTQFAEAPASQPSPPQATETVATATPVHVKSSLGSKHAEEVSAPPSIAFADTNDNKLSGLMASGAPSLPKQALSNLKISQGVSQGLLIKRVPPKYPPAARATHTQGEVRIEATVTKEGMVVNPKVLKGDTVLAHAAVEAVRQWRYKPYYLDGQPVEVQTEITINFKAD